MKNYIQPLGPVDITAHMVRAVREIKDYTAILVLEDRRVGSGVFVNTCGYNGILTAHHVATAIMDGSEFGLCVTEYPHGLFVRSENCQHVPIGYVPCNPQPEIGPDLSFIIIRDRNLLSTLQSRKSFCHLETKDLEYFQSPLDRMNWCIAGSPYRSAKLVGVTPDGPLMKYNNFVGEAFFHSRTIRDGFDYLQLRVPCDEEAFPANCEGMSGGGMWLVPLSISPSGDPNTIRHEPILAGVSYYQFELEDGERVIKGHGYDSVYSRVRKGLKKITTM